MVNRTDSNITDNVNGNLVANFAHKSPSLKRWFRQLFYLPVRYHKLFNKQVKEKIEDAVALAEVGSRGQIKVVVEGNLPLGVAYLENTQRRAMDLFSILGIWDTEHNSGVLLYTNLCEKSVSIIADRGINSFVSPDHWQHICDQVIDLIKQKRFADGICLGVEEIGNTLREYYHSKHHETDQNELSNAPVFM